MLLCFAFASLALLLLSPSVLYAATPLHLNNVLSSNMVLQRAPQSSQLWGTGEPGHSASALLDNTPAGVTTIDKSGRWMLALPPHRASLNHTISVTDGNTTITLSNVAFGDVYLCSGQSNMQVVLNYSWGGAEAMAMADRYPNIRLLNIPTAMSNFTLNEVTRLSYSPAWVLPSADTLQNPRNGADLFSYFSAVCYWTGMHVYDSLNGTIPIGLVQSSYAGTVIAAWTANNTDTPCGPVITPPGTSNSAHNQPSVLWNAMIHPLLPMRLRAVLWYQGEQDTFDPDRYSCSFPYLIQEWRRLFYLPNLPFYFVLLAPYSGAWFVPLRQAQLDALRLPHTGAASTLDAGDFQGALGSGHPRNKSIVGERLARWVRRDIYGQQVVAEGPRVQSVTAHTTATPNLVTIEVQYNKSAISDGMYFHSTPNCTANTICCTTQNDGSIIGLANVYSSQSSKPTPLAVQLDAAGRRLFGNVSLAVGSGSVLSVAFVWVSYPGCLLYNRYGVPALPSYHNVTVMAGARAESVGSVAVTAE